MSDGPLTDGESKSLVHDDSRRRAACPPYSRGHLAFRFGLRGGVSPISCTEWRRALAAHAPMQTLHSEITSTPAPIPAAVRDPVTPHRVLLWRLHGATKDLACAAVETSYGYAFCLELDGEPILLELQRSLEALTSKASRLEASLLARGWEIVSA